MSIKQLNCQSCAAPLNLKYRFSKMAVCEYCGQATYLTGADSQEAQGKASPLIDYGSKFSIGQKLVIKNTKFEIIGRIRFSYPDGFWDEWFLIDNKHPDTEYWLQEDEGEYILFGRNDKVKKFPNFAKTKVGSTHSAFNETIFVNEKNTAQIMGGEGELPFQVVEGEKANFIDGIVVKKGVPVSYEYLPKETLLYIGFDVKLDEISIVK